MTSTDASPATTEVAVIIPLWRRTANVGRVLASLAATTPEARPLLVVSRGDRDVVEYLGGAGLLGVTLLVDGDGGEPGDYARKINAGYGATTEPLIFTGADDVVFTPNWFAPARALMGQRLRCVDCGAEQRLEQPDARIHERAMNPESGVAVFHDGCTIGRGFGVWEETSLVAVVGTVDQCNGRTMTGAHSTHTLIARWYADSGACVDQDHVVYHEGYWHEYCDDELVRTAMARGVYAHSFTSVVEHRHWLVDPARDDATYRHGRTNTRRSAAVFRRRRVLWGDRRAQSQQQYARRPRVRKRER